MCSNASFAGKNVRACLVVPAKYIHALEINHRVHFGAKLTVFLFHLTKAPVVKCSILSKAVSTRTNGKT